MRLFIAVLLKEEVKSGLYDTIGRLKASAKGNFTQRENLHLTLNFIGETGRLAEVKAAMERAVSESDVGHFTLSIGGFGKFTRREGDIYWAGVEREPSLWKLQKCLVKELKEEGFYEIDDHEYRPHLTLGRRVKPEKYFDEQKFASGVKPMQMNVNKISLMKSERVQGRLTYTELYEVSF